jgi:hypothetical protein
MKWIKIIAGINTCKSPLIYRIAVEYTPASRKSKSECQWYIA